MAKNHLKFTQETLVQAQLAEKKAEEELQELNLLCVKLR